MTTTSAPRVGFARRAIDETTYLAGLVLTICATALRPSTWRAPVREVLARQVLFSGVQALGFVALVAILVGLGVVLQTRLWLSQFGQSALLGPLLVVVIVRELAPLLVNLIVIVRSGSAITTELGNMSVHREVDALEVQGIDPMRYLVVPRVIGIVASVMCLTVFFDLVAFASGYVASVFLELNPARPVAFIEQVLAPLHLADALSPLLKASIPPLLFATFCCHAGLSVGRVTTAVPQAATRALSTSLLTVFVVSVLITAISYQ